MVSATREERKIELDNAAERRGSDRDRLRIAYALSGAIAALMIVASLAGLLVDGMYADAPWAREALRGGDLTTLVLVAPVLITALAFSIRGSTRAQAVWLGAMAYSVYNYAYYALGAQFNDIFVLHIALVALSIWAVGIGIASVDVGLIAASFDVRRSSRWVGAFFVLVGSILGGLWFVLAVRFAITGELMADVPVDGVHLVFAIDLILLVPALVVAGALLWRRTSTGTVYGVAIAVTGTLYQVNLLVAGVFQANADVPGSKAFPPEGVGVAIGFALSLLFLFSQGGRARLGGNAEEGRKLR